MIVRPLRQGLIALTVLALAACGDPNHDPARGYIKAPLERPGLIVQGEEVSEMAELGEPTRPRAPQPEDVPQIDG
jgi:hypothetical protein